MGALAGKTILITGGSRGIGAAIAVRCAKDGANIVIASKTVEPHHKLEGTIFETARLVEEAGGKALPLQLDVREDARVEEVIRQSADHFGGLDIVINNAGAINLIPVEQLAPKRFDLMNQINVRAVYLTSHFAIPFLKKSSHAHILNLSPPIDLSPHWLAGKTPYTVSKYGMSMMTVGMAEELRGYGIGVNSLWPRTTIATAAVNMLGGEALMAASRTVDIMADAAYEILSSNPKEVTGNLFLDEPLLRQRGYTDFDRYTVTPGAELQLDFYVSE